MKGFSSIFLVLLLVSCETTMTDDDWPEHDAKLVIIARLQLTTDSVFVFCRISRTMGLGEKFNEEGAMVNDAEVNILNDGKARSIPFRQNYDPFTSDANYIAVFPRDAFTEYVLTVRHGALNARAALSIPDIFLRFDSLTMYLYPSDWWRFAREVLFTLATPIARMRYDLLIEEQSSSGQWMEALRLPRTLIDGTLSTTTSKSFYWETSSDACRGRYTLIARSPEFRNYEDSRWGPDYSGSPFEPNAKNPPFNITGDGIGFFWYDLVGDPVEFDY